MLNFLNSVIKEMKNIKWPTRNVVLISSLLVIVICVIISAYLYVIDLGLRKTILNKEIKKESITTDNNSIASTTATTTDTLSTTTNIVDSE